MEEYDEENLVEESKMFDQEKPPEEERPEWLKEKQESQGKWM